MTYFGQFKLYYSDLLLEQFILKVYHLQNKSVSEKSVGKEYPEKSIQKRVSTKEYQGYSSLSVQTQAKEQTAI